MKNHTLVGWLFCLFLPVLVNAQTMNVWQHSYGSYGGNVRAVAIFGDVVLASVEGAGIFRSTDRGAHWFRSSLSDSIIVGIAGNDSIVFAAGNVKFGFAYSLYASTDRGATWFKESSFSRVDAWPFLDHLYTDGPRVMTVGRGSPIMYSTNNGARWDTINLKHGYTLSGALWHGNLFVGTSDSGLYRSADQGHSWIRSDVGISGVRGVPAIAAARTALFAIVTRARGLGSALFRSVDSGATWGQVVLGERTPTMVAALGDTILLFTDNDGLFISSDGEQFTQTRLGRGPAGSALAGCDSLLFAGTWGGGLLRSTDLGGTWAKVIDSLNAANVSAFGFGGGHRIYAAVESGSLSYSEDRGAHWRPVDTIETISGIPASDSLAVLSIAAHGSTLWLGTTHGLYRSLDKGVHLDGPWTFRRSIWSVQYAPPVVLAAGDTEIYRSTDNGATWSTIRPGMLDGSWIWNIVLADSGRAYFTTGSAGLFFSSDTGSTWSRIGLDNYPHPNIALIGNAILAFTDGGYQRGPQGGIYRSTDNGTTWEHMPYFYHYTDWDFDYSVRAMVPVGDKIYFAVQPPYDWARNVPTRPEIYVSSDSGKTVQRCNGTLPYIDISTMAFADSTFFLGTYNNGVWYARQDNLLDVSTGYSAFAPVVFRLEPNYPNPFNPSTTIRFSLGKASHVSLVVYNLLGQEVARLADEDSPAGEYSRVWSAANFSSGIYFYKLHAGNYDETRKLVLIR